MTKELGIIGLGRMGGGLALQAAEKGIRVVGVTRGGLRPELVSAGIEEAREPADLRRALSAPRVVLLYVAAGVTVDQLIDELGEVLEPGDVVGDGGNSYWGDSIRRHQRLAGRGIQLVDVGTSGGVDGARHGACFMVGGEREAIAGLEPLLRVLAVEGGFVHAGPPGAGHFVKLVHNGIEFGMLQAIAEGLDLLEHHDAPLDVQGVLGAWRHGSVIRSWLVDLLEEQYRVQDGGAAVPPYIEDTGEVSWLIADALRMERPIPVIAQAVMQLATSRDADRTWARAIAMMRHGFGGHPFGPDDAIRQERQTSRVGDFIRRTRRAPG